MKQKIVLIFLINNFFCILTNIENINSENSRNLDGEGDQKSASQLENPVEQEASANETQKSGEADIVQSLYHRAFSINDKIDHLLFHHNHDVTGKTAQFTPFGIHFLPKYKGNDSVDQKLKMVDYMHSMGGFHPASGFTSPYLFSHDQQESSPTKSRILENKISL